MRLRNRGRFRVARRDFVSPSPRGERILPNVPVGKPLAVCPEVKNQSLPCSPSFPNAMKTTILATSIVTFIAATSLAQTSPITINDSTVPSLKLEIYDSSGPVDSVIYQYTHDQVLVGTAYQSRAVVESYANSSLNYTSWVWRTNTGTAMWLQQDGTLSLVPTGSSTPGITLGADGTIIFGDTTASPTIARAGSTLTLGGSPILTVASANDLYLRVGADRFQLGNDAVAQTALAFAYGDHVRASGRGATALGAGTLNPDLSVAATLRAEGTGATALGYGSVSTGSGATSIGLGNYATADAAVALGRDTQASYANAVAIGNASHANAVNAVAIGLSNIVTAGQGVALGWGNTIGTGGDNSIVGGCLSEVRGDASASFGAYNTILPGSSFATALGGGNVVGGPWSWGGLAVGIGNYSTSTASIALGYSNTASNRAAIAMGDHSLADAPYSLAMGHWSEVTATGYGGTAIGVGARATGTSQFVVGSYNLAIDDTTTTVRSDNDAAFIVGNGYQTTGATDSVTHLPVPVSINDYVTSPEHVFRRNALVVRWNGNVEAAGQLKASETGGLYVPGTIRAVNGKVLVPKSGDIDMGEFATGEAP